MHFIVIAYDDSDEQAPERRAAARDAHVESAKQLYSTGKWLFAVGILDDHGNPIGSMIVCDFPSAAALDEEWLGKEPYVVGGVWKTVTVNQAFVAPFCLKD